MPRRDTIKIQPHPCLKKRKHYRVVVFHIEKMSKRRKLLVLLRHLDAVQVGREAEVLLPLPARPAGRTADFLRACGCVVKENFEIAMIELRGRQLKIVYDDGDDGQLEVSQFLAISQENNDVPTAE